ncbi:MAG: NADP-dependent phosphogluconate dehydrogenase [Chloroflexia bacterium]|nr:NADP-dependent phosphogluconate dehydrogenase [Chloroflexia bacterium]
MSTTLKRSEGAERAARRENGADKRHVGVVGLAVMGENLARNIERNGFAPVVYNRTAERTEEVLAGPAKDTSILGKFSIRDFVAELERPRRIILMVKAGNAVDAVIGELKPFLEQGDILIDGGNSFFHDTERRSQDLAGVGFHYVGMGVSGGEEGALWGPSLMPGGPAEAYTALEPMLTAIAATSDSGPCVTHIGPGGSGHYVKMVHNGIEYGDMQLIAETYDVMRKALGMSAPEIADVFARWNSGRLASFLIEITETVLNYVDVETGAPLVDVIADEAEQKGTGRWTSQSAFELATPTPVINAAVIARGLSALKPLRLRASTILHGPGTNGGTLPKAPERERVIDSLEDALYFAKIASYAQGMALMAAASEAYSWDLDLAEIARIWKAGCIIRAKLLDPIMAAFAAEPALENLLFAPTFADALNDAMPGMRAVRHIALDFGIPTPGMSDALDYVDTLRAEHLPANLIQGQRDFFGAHTYKRIDKPGTFHTEWVEPAPAERPKTRSEPSTRQAWADGQGEGDRAAAPAAAPADAGAEVLRPQDHEDMVPDAEERGERSEKGAQRADY